MEQNLKSYIEELISEIQNELDEATVSGDIAGYNVPGAFSNGGSKDKKRKKKIATQFGYKIVGNIDEGMFSTLDQIKKDSLDLKAFIKNVFSDRQFKDVKSDKEFHKYLKSLYNESVSESGEDINNAVIPGGVRIKLQKALDIVKGTKLSYQQKLQVVGRVLDSLSIDKKELSKISSKLKTKLESVVTEGINEGMVSPKNGHEFFQLTKDTPIKYITKSYTTVNTPGVLWKNDTDYIDGKKGAYLIDYFGAAFYVDLKKKFASKIYPIKDQPKLSWKSNFIDVDKAPEMSDWKKFLKESVDEYKGTGKARGGSPEPKFKPEVTSDVKKALELIKKGFYLVDNNTALEHKKGGYVKLSKRVTNYFNNIKESVNEGPMDRIFGGIPYTKKGKQSIVTMKLPDDVKERIIQRAKKEGKVAKPNNGGGVTVFESVNEAKVKRPVNRWLELKNDETMHAHKKMAMGLKELKYQLGETQKFFNWYNKIKTMNELDSSDYWKRTQSHIYKIKERLINIAKTLQEIEK
jgi:hypothetical protein